MKRLSRRTMLLATLTSVAFTGLHAPSALAHPFHTTAAEVEYNPKAKSLEVSLRVLPDDLERALSNASGRKIELEKSPDLDRLIADYLRAHFTVTRASGKKAPLQWVGKELGVKAVWLYFQFDVQGTLAGTTLLNGIFFELNSHQANTVKLRVGEKKRVWTFTPGQKAKDIG